MKTDQSDVLLGQRLDLIGEPLKELGFLKRQITVAQLALHGRGKGARVLHHDLFRFGGVHRAWEVQCQFGANLIPIHGTGARHSL
jgi:hypothetical protein